MSARAALAAACALAVLAPGTAAVAGETGCWFENGAIVAPAEIAGIAGDWLVDPSQPRTLLHETRAEMEGLPASFTAVAHLGGQTLADVSVTVANLDARSPGFVTPIVGVIGADLLGRVVVDLDFAPCRVRVTRSGHAPPFGPARQLRLVEVGGAPAVTASIADDRTARTGAFAIDWGSAAAVRVAGATVVPVREGVDPTLRTRSSADLRALSLDGVLYETQSASLAADLDPALVGTLGLDFWSRWRVRLDVRHGRLLLGAKRKGPGIAPGP